MNAPAKIDAPKASLHEAARRALDASHDQAGAVDRLVSAARRDKALREALLAPWEYQAAQHVIGALIRQDRRTIWSRPSAPDARVAALSNAVSLSLLDFRLPGGKPLRDASAEDVSAAAGFYAEQAADMDAKARWLNAVAAALPDGAVVGDALDVATLDKLREEAGA
jgi:hypothetical protein